MKIVTWNCNGALRKKLKELETLDADVYVIQECEDPAQSHPEYRTWAGDYLWVGKSKNRGLGVFPKRNNRVAVKDWNGSFAIPGLQSNSNTVRWTTGDLQLFLPFALNDEIAVVAVWTKGVDARVFRYMGQMWKYLQIHRAEISQSNTLLLGDFNSNTIWDKRDRWWNHSDVVDELKELGMQSVYHQQFSQAHGEETTPTFFLHRKESKPYHIDYVFASKDLLGRCQIEIGEKETWLAVSDHMPVCVSV